MEILDTWGIAIEEETGVGVENKKRKTHTQTKMLKKMNEMKHKRLAA